MYSKDISWVQIDVTRRKIDKLNNFDIANHYFYYKEAKTPKYDFESEYDIALLNDIMFSIGYKLVSVENMIGFERLLYAWNSSFFFPIKETHSVASFLCKEMNFNMRGLAHSAENWLHMLISKDNKYFDERTLSLQHELSNGTYVSHDIETKKILVEIDNFLTENDRNSLIQFDENFDGLFETIDYAFTVLRYV